MDSNGLGCCGGVGSISSLMQWVKGSSVATAAVEVTAVDQIQSMTQELQYAMGTSIKRKKKSVKMKEFYK